jgi:hypothetical protein
MTRTLLALMLLTAAAPVRGEEDRGFLYVNELGDAERGEGGPRRALHATALLGLETAGYFRGLFDDAPEDLDVLQSGPSLRLTLRLPEGLGLRGPTLTVGSGNNFWTDQPIPAPEGGPWFESDNFIGAAAELAPGWRGALTYTAYLSPNGASPEFQELAAALRRTEDVFGLALAPQLKAAFRTENGEGLFLQASAAASTPAFGLGAREVALAFPVEVGVGLGGYYGEGNDGEGYATLGAVASTPLANGPLGTWTLAAKAVALARTDALAALDPPAADGDPVVIWGGLSLGFAY